ncbi:MAG: hypothetical protein ACKO2L_17145 [Planctomycetaceae bacterium]
MPGVTPFMQWFFLKRTRGESMNAIKEAQRKLKAAEKKLKQELKEMEDKARESLQLVADNAALVYVKENDSPDFDDCVYVVAAACAGAAGAMGSGGGPWGAAGAAALGAGAGVPLARIACRRLIPKE